ncbi:HAD family hydrolase [Frigidibacter sp. ROC022]|uniref:HAD family hydrolase n=1 Tax=Frigidibacter sp. ROC022 TaxID=2971796 RepID=UPI00215B6A64|nr:HAD family hydrolase [Frigidibacter sp. ROC022]MCR8726452.1 HAD family hydrolase [Frigidibacter sp. ROC022]
MRPELVIFDCDGVLIDSEVISAQMLIEALIPYGIEIDRGFVTRHFLGRSYPVVLAEVRSRFGVDLPPSFEAEYRARLLEAFETRLKVMPGAPEVLAGMTLPWCVATSSSPARARRSLEITGLAGLVGDRLLTVAEVKHGKPAPDLFLLAASRMGVEPGRCLVLEDSLNGIRAARAAGMEVWRFTGGCHLRGMDLTEPEDARSDRAIASFAQLGQVAPKIFAGRTNGQAPRD